MDCAVDGRLGLVISARRDHSFHLSGGKIAADRIAVRALAVRGFAARQRDEKLNETLFITMHQVRVELAQWRDDYNYNRPHSGLGWLTPSEFANLHTPMQAMAMGAVQREGSAPMAIAPNAQHGLMNRQSELKAG